MNASELMRLIPDVDNTVNSGMNAGTLACVARIRMSFGGQVIRWLVSMRSSREGSELMRVAGPRQPVNATPALDLGRMPSRSTADRAARSLPLTWADAGIREGPRSSGVSGVALTT
jgi:hypothetical protein